MLIKRNYICDKCHGQFRAMSQYQVRKCKRCGKMFVFCDDCKPTATCDWCGGAEFDIYDPAIEYDRNNNGRLILY